MMDRESLMGKGHSSFLRRIKTRIVGPEHHFAVIAPRELAQSCLKEVEGIGISKAEITEAGIEFTGKLKGAYNCHLELRTASRVFCRIPPFRAGVSEELFYRVSQIPWELWMNQEIPLVVEARVEYSRIRHEGKTADLVYQGIGKRLIEMNPHSQPVGRALPGPE
jgi:23S rRNA G2445 N2-methylase RlmL